MQCLSWHVSWHVCPGMLSWHVSWHVCHVRPFTSYGGQLFLEAATGHRHQVQAQLEQAHKTSSDVLGVIVSPAPALELGVD